MKPLMMASLLVVSSLALGADKKVSAREQLARLEKELAEQRAMLVRVLELQSACTAQMLQVVQGGALETAVVEAPPVLPPAPSPAPVASIAPVTPRTAKAASLTGTVHVASGGPAWVFVEDVKGPPGAPLEIKQEDKQFSPRVAVVPLGTRVNFPNVDVVYHNVFSLTPGQSFDLGMLRAGDPVKSRLMARPGVVDIFCNLHARMSATVLVTPGPLVAKVGADGHFKLDGVPVGTRRVSAWAGGHAVATKTVELGAGGAALEFQLEGPGESGPHVTKTGQPYGSYDD